MLLFILSIPVMLIGAGVFIFIGLPVIAWAVALAIPVFLIMLLFLLPWVLSENPFYLLIPLVIIVINLIYYRSDIKAYFYKLSSKA